LAVKKEESQLEQKKSQMWGRRNRGCRKKRILAVEKKKISAVELKKSQL
jgi:hypothetical protein